MIIIYDCLERKFGCFIFHDVDLLLEDTRCILNCNSSPIHFSIWFKIYLKSEDYRKLSKLNLDILKPHFLVAIDKFNYRLPYPNIFGGVVGFKDWFQYWNLKFMIKISFLAPFWQPIHEICYRPGNLYKPMDTG